MSPQKGIRVRKIAVPTDTHTEFELGDTHSRYTEEGGEGGKRQGERGTETEGGSQEGGNYTLSRGGSGRKA